MADVVTTILISDVSYTSWLRTSTIGAAMIADGIPLIKTNEMGPDQVDKFKNFMTEASRELLKVFLSRQGDAAGVPFEQTATEVIYRFNEETPVLPQASTIKEALNEDVKNALYSYITLLWFKLKLNKDQVAALEARYEKLSSNIDRHLYKLHD